MKDAAVATFLRTGGLLIGLAATATAGAHGRPHDLMNLDISVDADRLTFQVDSPLDSLLGFGHSPRSAIQRTAAATLLKRVEDGEWLVRIDPQAECVLARTEVAAPALNRPAQSSEVSSSAAVGTPVGDHGSLIASYEYECGHIDALDSVQLSVFDEFSRIQRIAIRVAGGGGQFGATLKRGSGTAMVRLKR